MGEPPTFKRTRTDELLQFDYGSDLSISALFGPAGEMQKCSVEDSLNSPVVKEIILRCPTLTPALIVLRLHKLARWVKAWIEVRDRVISQVLEWWADAPVVTHRRRISRSTHASPSARGACSVPPSSRAQPTSRVAAHNHPPSSSSSSNSNNLPTARNPLASSRALSGEKRKSVAVLAAASPEEELQQRRSLVLTVYHKRRKEFRQKFYKHRETVLGKEAELAEVSRQLQQGKKELFHERQLTSLQQDLRAELESLKRQRPKFTFNTSIFNLKDLQKLKMKLKARKLSRVATDDVDALLAGESPRVTSSLLCSVPSIISPTLPFSLSPGLIITSCLSTRGPASISFPRLRGSTLGAPSLPTCSSSASSASGFSRNPSSDGLSESVSKISTLSVSVLPERPLSQSKRTRSPAARTRAPTTTPLPRTPQRSTRRTDQPATPNMPTRARYLDPLSMGSPATRVSTPLPRTPQ